MSDVNVDQIEFWNVVQGDKWVRLMNRIDALLGPFGDAAMAALAPVGSERILDVGCGFGSNTIALAEAVGPRGHVVGIDISKPMIAHARERVPANAEILEADAQIHGFEPGSFDAAFSRFGVMFFEHPETAFANLRRAVRPGGRLAFVAWRTRRDNPWIMEMVGAARPYLELPPRPGPDEPGQFSFEDPERVRRILDAAGWSDVVMEAYSPTLSVGVSVADAVDFLSQMGPTAQPLAEADEDTRRKVIEAAHTAYARFADGPDQPPRLEFGAWIVTARHQG